MSGARRRGLGITSLLVLLVALIATGAASWGTYAVVHGQEMRLLKSRAGEIDLLLTSTLQSYSSTLSEQGAVLKATKGSRAAYTKAALSAVAVDPGHPTFAWLRPSGSGYEVLAVSGDAFRPGDLLTDRARTGAFAAAMRQPTMLATAILPPDRRLGFVLGPPAAPAGTVLYRETALGPVQAPRAASTAPYAELDVAIYGAQSQQPAAVLATTTKRLPLRTDVRDEPLVVGGVHWLVSAKARTPLVGNVAASAWWVTLIAGLVGSVLLAAVVEASRRRRDTALALYASEHHVAETLQRSLLPQLPTIAGIEAAARYLAGARGQEVGGDWFDVFPVAGGGIAVTVGDVIGHDLAAASAMAQIRAAVRAYAIDGAEPRLVIDRLDELVRALNLTQLATVVYGVLGPPGADGSRTFTYTNAGHPRPLVRDPSGAVEPLRGGESVLIGAPTRIAHSQTARRIEAGSTLLLFTDGLVEIPDRSLDDTTGELMAAFADSGGSTDLEDVCERILVTTADRELRDDIAVLAIRIAVGAQVPRHTDPIVRV